MLIQGFLQWPLARSSQIMFLRTINRLSAKPLCSARRSMQVSQRHSFLRKKIQGRNKKDRRPFSRFEIWLLGCSSEWFKPCLMHGKLFPRCRASSRSWKRLLLRLEKFFHWIKRSLINLKILECYSNWEESEIQSSKSPIRIRACWTPSWQTLKITKDIARPEKSN